MICLKVCKGSFNTINRIDSIVFRKDRISKFNGLNKQLKVDMFSPPYMGMLLVHPKGKFNVTECDLQLCLEVGNLKENLSSKRRDKNLSASLLISFCIHFTYLFQNLRYIIIPLFGRGRGGGRVGYCEEAAVRKMKKRT